VDYRRSIHDLLCSSPIKGTVRLGINTKSLGRTVKNGAPHCYVRIVQFMSYC
jgi:hypothetical protein